MTKKKVLYHRPKEAVKRQVQRNSTRNDIFRERGDSFKYRLNRRRETCGDNQVSI
jgi:hypothetical protein